MKAEAGRFKRTRQKIFIKLSFAAHCEAESIAYLPILLYNNKKFFIKHHINGYLHDINIGGIFVNGYYEHHTTISKDRLCPFKMGFHDDTQNVACNWHKNLEILWIEEGSGNIQYGKRFLEVSQGDIILVNSEVLHRPYSDGPMQHGFIIIDEQFCAENGVSTAARTYAECFRDAETEKLIHKAVERMKEYKNGGDYLSAARARAAILELVIDITARHSCRREEGTEKPNPSEAYIKRVIGYLNENYTEHISLEELAKLCGITKQYLAREFKRATGQTVCTYTNMLRCKKAGLALSEGASVAEAAMESGFESLSYFSRTYKKMMGTVPSKSR